MDTEGRVPEMGEVYTVSKLPVTVFVAAVVILTALWLRRAVRLQAASQPQEKTAPLVTKIDTGNLFGPLRWFHVEPFKLPPLRAPGEGSVIGR